MRRSLLSALLALAAGASAAPGAPAGDQAGNLSLSLAPQPVSRGAAAIGRVAVTLRFGSVAVAAGAPLLRLPVVVSNVDTAATTLADLSASDARGPLALTARDVTLPAEAARDADTGGPSREWTATRAVAGPLTVRYTVAAAATLPPRGPAPPFAWSDDGNATSAAGHVFLPLPPGDARYRLHVAWDLSALPPGARGISSLGEGNVASPAPLSAGEVRETFYMAGRIGAWPTPVPASGFFGAWQGRPPFDAAALLAWTGRLHEHYARFFGQATPPSYGVFLRYNPINAGGGVGLYHAFVATFGQAGGAGSDPAKLRITLAHEMFHTFQPFITDPAGLASSWFGEGLAVFYERQLPLRFGMIGPDAFLADLNATAARYYTSAMANVPNSEVPRRFWADTRIRTLPYDRGALYFATVDDALRKASAGRRSLDTLMLAMLARERSGRPLSNADWEALLRDALGPGAVDAFRAFLAGHDPLPASDAFGPCFRRTTTRLRRYELGFDTAVLAEPVRVVRGLVPGGPAAAAGLREGDAIAKPVPQDAIQGDQHAMLDLVIRRGGRTFTLSYLPRGETVDAWQWERVPGVPDTACARRGASG